VRVAVLQAPRGFQAFAVAGFPALWSANVAWNVARWMEQIAIGWIALELTGSAFFVALVGFYRSLPLFLLGVFGGALGDRFDRRRLVLVLQATNVACVAVLAGLDLTGRLAYDHLAVVEIILGISMALDWPSRRALVVDLVGRDQLAGAVALDASGQNVSRMLGPLVSGALITVLNPGMALAILAAIYAANGVLLLRIPSAIGRAVVRVPVVWSSLRAGFGYVLRDDAIVGVLLITVWMNLLFFPYQQILPVVAVDVLKSGAVGLGVLSAADGLGSLVGTLLIAAFVGQRRNGMHFWVSTLAASVTLVLFALARSLPLALVLQAGGGLARAGFSAFQSGIVLRRSSEEMRGRAMGALTLAIGVGPFGNLEIGALAQALGAPLAIVLNAVACAMLCAIAAARLPGLRRV
jgi:MFS family permease